jgi:hypothetical protein
MGKHKHARFSPSSHDSLEQCIRFEYLQQDDGDENAAASEGQMLHDAYERECLAGLDDEQKNCVQGLIDYRNSLLATEGGPDCWELIKEGKWTLEDRTYGRADDVLIHKTKPIVHVNDAKFTRRDDDHSHQVETYGAAVFEERFLGTKFEDEVIIHTHVAMPRVKTIHSETYKGTELYKKTCDRIDALYERIEDPFNPPTPHEDLCERCNRAGKCPALGKAVVQVAQGIGLPLPEVFAPNAIVSLRDRALAQVLAGALKTWAEKVKKANNEFAKEGNDIPGFTLRSRSNGYRAGNDVTNDIFATLKDSGVDEAEILNACTFSLSKFAKNRSAISMSSEAEIKEEVQAQIGEYLTESSSQFLVKAKRIDDVTALKAAAQIGG